MTPDDDLVRAVLQGDREAFAPLVERHQRAAFACAFAVTSDHAAAEDLVQDGFVRAFQRLDTCRDATRFRPWLLSIVRHLALNHLRTARRHPTTVLSEDTNSGSVPPVEPTDTNHERVHLLRALQQLSPIQREVLVLADLEHLSHFEIAQRTGISVLMSRRHVSDARRLVRNALSLTRSPYAR